MSLKKILISLFILFEFASNISAQNITDVKGILIDSVSQLPLIKATLIRLSDNKVFFTDSTGTFDITCTNNDAVRISYIGFFTIRIIVNNIPDSIRGNKKYLRIEMRRDIHGISQIVINEAKKNNEDSVYYTQALKPMATSIMSPISLIYAQFSKKEKEKEQLNDMLQKKYFEDFLKYRLPKQCLYNLTGDKIYTLDDLKKNCMPADFFILNASDYELYQWVKSCYHAYKK